MSDNYLRIIPIDPDLVPPESVAHQLVELIRPAFPEADEVVAERHEHPVFIDQGSNLEAVLCPACGKRLTLDGSYDRESVQTWWYELADTLREAQVADVRATMPCCSAIVPFPELQFDWPAGIASFEISILNPRPVDPPSDDLCREIQRLLGNPVRYIWAHY